MSASVSLGSGARATADLDVDNLKHLSAKGRALLAKEGPWSAVDLKVAAQHLWTAYRLLDEQKFTTSQSEALTRAYITWLKAQEGPEPTALPHWACVAPWLSHMVRPAAYADACPGGQPVPHDVAQTVQLVTQKEGVAVDTFVKEWSTPLDLGLEKLVKGIVDGMLEERSWVPTFKRELKANDVPVNLSCEWVRYHERSYRQFLALLTSDEPDVASYLSPHIFVDLFWHTHQVHPQHYGPETRDLTGSLVVHDPFPDRHKMPHARESAMRSANSAWKRYFGMNQVNAKEEVKADRTSTTTCTFSSRVPSGPPVMCAQKRRPDPQPRSRPMCSRLPPSEPEAPPPSLLELMQATQPLMCAAPPPREPSTPPLRKLSTPLSPKPAPPPVMCARPHISIPEPMEPPPPPVMCAARPPVAPPFTLEPAPQSIMCAATPQLDSPPMPKVAPPPVMCAATPDESPPMPKPAPPPVMCAAPPPFALPLVEPPPPPVMCAAPPPRLPSPPPSRVDATPSSPPLQPIMCSAPPPQ